eukprot:snap_masked-scaffold_6-processed-gene-14.10-mRNA-1 protein AED:1.00 eAED:1.00 QI:0/0/0/0/1/1/4/0/223
MTMVHYRGCTRGTTYYVMVKYGIERIEPLLRTEDFLPLCNKLYGKITKGCDTLDATKEMACKVSKGNVWQKTREQSSEHILGLLGLNVNRGQKILIRIRRERPKKITKKNPARDPLPRSAVHTIHSDKFLTYSSVLDTLLHELAHIVHSNHSADFYDLWNELREEMKNPLTDNGKRKLEKMKFPGIGKTLCGETDSVLQKRKMLADAAMRRLRKSNIEIIDLT